MIEIKKYNIEYKSIWDEFINNSKNGTFMLKRDYMDYHSDRFVDCSLMFYEDGKLIAVMPASLHENELRSHGGLTYGGMISSNKLSTQKTLEIFEKLKDFLKEKNIKKLIYKRVPSVYYTYPSDEDLYALFRIGAKLIRRDISTTIYLPDKIRFNERRRRNVKKAIKANLIFKETMDYESYFDILTEVLSSQHNAKPVHTVQEIKMLVKNFPQNIKLYASYNNDKMLAGCLIYETPTVAHAQYIANSKEGRECGALDFVFDELINKVYKDKTYFDFGISTENNGKYLNHGLIEQKQEFGGRGIVYDFYELEV